MKKVISLCFSLVFILMTFSGCVFDKEKTAVVISGTEINEEIYAYYLDKVTSRPTDYGLEEKADDEDLKQAAIELCKKYVALNTSFLDRGLSLTASEKVTVSSNVNNVWIRSEAHYNKIGVSRQTVSKILTSEAYEDAIFSSVFDTGTSDTAGEKKIMDYFYDNYLAFRSICAYYTGTNGQKITEQEKQTLKESFEGIVANAGETSQNFSDACTEAGYSASDIVIIEKGSEGYPTGFYDSLNMMDDGNVRTLSYDDVLFAVRKESMDEIGSSIYANYRSECIKEMYADEWQEMADTYLEKFTIDSVNV